MLTNFFNQDKCLDQKMFLIMLKNIFDQDNFLDQKNIFDQIFFNHDHKSF